MLNHKIRNMAMTRKFYLIIFNNDLIHEFNEILFKYSDSVYQSSSHYLFNVNLNNATVTSEDVSYFTLTADDEADMDKKLKELMEELNKLDSYYSIKDSESGEVYSIISKVGAVDIKFDNLDTIPEGVYKKIDRLKNCKMDFGYTKGYNPKFRVIEGKTIEDLEVQTETIYLFSDSSENMEKLHDYMTEKIKDIHPDFVIENRVFI